MEVGERETTNQNQKSRHSLPPVKPFVAIKDGGVSKTGRIFSKKAAMAMSDESGEDGMLSVDSDSDEEDLYEFSDDDYSE